MGCMKQPAADMRIRPPDDAAARGKLEAVIRLSTLTDRKPEGLGPGSKERKSVLANLAVDLGLDVDLRRSKPALGRQIALSLGAAWDETCWSTGSTVTLEGLNRILLAAESRVTRQRESTQLAHFGTDLRPGAGPFVPARSKIEVVSRISALTSSPPETLGPGSKERKSVLVNLAHGLGLRVDTTLPKPELGAAIASAIGAAWDTSCWSAGHTITLIGLNHLLEAAEAKFASAVPARGAFTTVRHEAQALLQVISQALPRTWEGRECIEEMREAEYAQWAQDEWAAFYLEFVGLPALINTFGGGPVSYANTRFDYGLGRPWDLKVHMTSKPVSPLNDCQAVEEALDAGVGVGFLVLSGDVEYDEGTFREWQRAFRAAHGKKSRPRAGPPRYKRKSKPRFRPFVVDAFFIRDRAALDCALDAGIVRVMRQGAQTSGAARAPKYSLDLVRARLDESLLLAQLVL
jgi:hypothetical protein